MLCSFVYQCYNTYLLSNEGRVSLFIPMAAIVVTSAIISDRGFDLNVNFSVLSIIVAFTLSQIIKHSVPSIFRSSKLSNIVSNEDYIIDIILGILFYL